MIEIQDFTGFDGWVTNLDEFDYSLFITNNWIESLRNENQVPVYMDFLKDCNQIAKLAGLLIGKKGSIYSKLFFYAGPAFAKSISIRLHEECLTALYSYGKRSGFNRIVVLSYDYPNVYHRHPRFSFRERSEYIIDLSRSEKEIDHCVSRNIKRSVKKATEHGYELKDSNDESLLNPLIHLMEETKKLRLSKGYSKYTFFYLPMSNQTVLQKLVRSGSIRFFVVKKDETIHGIMAVFMHNLRAYGMFIGISEQGYRDGVPSFIEYHMIHLLKSLDFQIINLGGIPVDKSHEGLVSFKRKLGCQEQLSSHGSTNFLQFPYFLMNPAVHIARMFPENCIIKFFVKNHID